MVPNPLIDLTTLSLVKTWLSAYGTPPQNTMDDANIQACITAASSAFMWMTGRGSVSGVIIPLTSPPISGVNPTVSPFVAPVLYTETYDGNGSPRMFLKNYPILSISSLVIGNWIVPQSTGWGTQGYVIDGGGVSITLRGGGGTSVNFWSLGGYYGLFWKGFQNIFITYTAGYYVTPPDIQLAITKWAALNYVRRDWIGLVNQSMGANAGTTTYLKDEFDQDVKNLIYYYSRVAAIF